MISLAKTPAPKRPIFATPSRGEIIRCFNYWNSYKLTDGEITISWSDFLSEYRTKISRHLIDARQNFLYWFVSITRESEYERLHDI